MNGIWFNLYVGDIVIKLGGAVNKTPCYVRSKQIRLKDNSLNEGLPPNMIESLEDQFHSALMSIDKHLRRSEWKKGVA